MEQAVGVGIVGRAGELRRLRELVTAAAQRRGDVLVLSAEPGAGKTTLVGAALAEAEARSVHARVGRARQVEFQAPYAAITAALGRVPALRPRTDGRGLLDGGSTTATPFLVGDRLLDRLEAGVAEQPTLLVIEDLHWAETATIHWLAEVVTRAPDLGLAVLATTRVPRSGSDLAHLLAQVSEGSGDVRPLPPLAPADVALVATNVLGRPPGPVLTQLLERSSGNPLVVHAVLQALQLADALDLNGGQAEVRSEGVGLQPGSLVDRQLAELDESALSILQTASLLGQPIDVSDLATITQRAPLELAGALDAAVGVGALVRTREGYEFRHDLHRDAVQATLPTELQQVMHLDIARRLISAGTSPFDVAHHVVRGARRGDRTAIDWLRTSAVDVVDHAPGVSLDLLDRALDLCAGAPGVDLLLARLHALAGTGRTADARALADSLLHEGLEPATEAVIQRELALVFLIQGATADSVRAIERFAELVAETGNVGRAAAETAFAKLVNLDHPGAGTAARIAVEEGERDGDLATQVAAGGVLAWLALFDCRFPEALERAHRIVRLAEQPHAAESHLYQPWFMAAVVYLEADLLDDLERAAEAGRRTAASTGMVWSAPGYDALSAYGALRRGALDEASASSAAALNYIEGVDGWGIALWCQAFLAQIALHQGDEGAAARHITEAEAWLVRDRGQFGFEQSMIAKARLAERQDRPGDALVTLADTWDLYGLANLHASRHSIGADLARLAVQAGDTQRAAQVVTHLESSAARSDVASFTAFAELARAWRDNDPDLAVTAAERFATTPRLPTTVLALGDASALLRQHGRHAEADACATRGAQLAGSIGADADADRLAALVRTAKPHRTPRPRFGMEALTPTERQVVELIADGLPNLAIAERLFVSRRTVESHVSAAYRKLEVGSRVEVARLVLRRR